MPSNPDLTLLKPGVRVKLRGDKSADKRKPWPRGWQTVAETDGTWVGEFWRVHHIRVQSDVRWLPVELIEETAHG